ncbi:hypothetical protein HDU79_009861 [Rhizoclosmatium sp. JEL0117]|nr:hypothetical protein HDU79_009861 [Rhizoclosmatium sp. JEL0117]
MIWKKPFSSAHSLILALLLAANVFADPYSTNWTALKYLPSPKVNGPPCHISNNTFGWNTIKLADGSLYTASKRPIVITTEGWDSYFLNAYVAQYLLEVMGYQTYVAQTGGGYSIGPEFYVNAIDLFLEAWPEDTANYEQLTQVDRVAVDMGAAGYSGVIGLYVPTPLVEKYPAFELDFWRFLLNPEARALFPASGSTPPYLVDGKPQCDGDPKQCVNGYYTPAQCKVPGAKCIELWAYDPAYSPSNFQRIIDSLGLMVTIKFIGWSADKAMTAALNAGQNVFVYNWAPTAFVAANNITRVLFPATDHQQYVNLVKDRANAYVTTDVPTIIIHKLATQKFLTDFPELQSFANKYQILDAHMNQMLKSTVEKNLNYSQAACQWIQENEDIWSPWIPTPPKSVVSCGIGQGRYLSGFVYSCIGCPSGTYNWNPQNTDECLPCPDKLSCPGGSVVLVTNGIWMPSQDFHQGIVAPEPYVCPMFTTCCHNGTCPAGTCSPSFKGITCTDCSEPDHYLWNAQCNKCSPAGGASFYLILFGAFLGAVLLLYLPFEEAPTVEILFFYFQVTYYIFQDQPDGVLTIPGLSTFLAIASLNIDGMVADCTLPIKGVAKMNFRFFLPLLIQVYIILIYFGMRFMNASGLLSGELAGKFTPYYMKGQSSTLICFRAAIVVLTFIIMPLIDASLILLQCVDILGRHVLASAPEVECFSSEHAPAAALAIIILIVFLGFVPLLIAYILKKLHKGGNIKYEEDGITNIERLFQCLYIVFKPEMYYMMPITMLEKGVTSILFTMLVRLNEMVRINVYIIFLGFLCATRIYWQPYHNALEAYLNREISLGILVMIAFRQYTDHYGVTNASLAQVGVIVFLPVVFHLIRWFRSNVEKHQDKIASVLASANITTTKTSSHSIKSQNGSTNSLSSKTNSMQKKRNSIEKIVPQRIVRTTSMLDREKKTACSQPPGLAVNTPANQASSGIALSKVTEKDQ